MNLPKIKKSYIIQAKEEFIYYDSTKADMQYFTTSVGRAKKYKYYLTAKMKSWLLGNCKVVTNLQLTTTQTK